MACGGRAGRGVDMQKDAMRPNDIDRHDRLHAEPAQRERFFIDCRERPDLSTM